MKKKKYKIIQTITATKQINFYFNIKLKYALHSWYIFMEKCMCNTFHKKHMLCKYERKGKKTCIFSNYYRNNEYKLNTYII